MSLITHLSDPRVAPFVDVTSIDKRDCQTHFIAEGENVTLRLLASSYRCEKVLCVDCKADRLRAHLQVGTELLVAPIELIQQIVGFKFHSGVMGLGVRPVGATPASPILFACKEMGDAGVAATYLILPEITDPANMGALFRVAAGFGVGAVILGERCRDPFTRQTVRTSMGTIFSLNLVQSRDIHADLLELKRRGVTLFATVLDADAERLNSVKPPARSALLLGNEGPGLERSIIAICDRKVTIPMKSNTDSLNVVVAGGIFLNHFAGAV